MVELLQGLAAIRRLALEWAGTSTPALAAIQDRAQSRVPALGYGMACAIGNVLLTLSGTIIVLLLGA